MSRVELGTATCIASAQHGVAASGELRDCVATVGVCGGCGYGGAVVVRIGGEHGDRCAGHGPMIGRILDPAAD